MNPVDERKLVPATTPMSSASAAHAASAVKTAAPHAPTETGSTASGITPGFAAAADPAECARVGACVTSRSDATVGCARVGKTARAHIAVTIRSIAAVIAVEVGVAIVKGMAVKGVAPAAVA